MLRKFGELLLWSGVFIIASGFQFYRGAPIDGFLLLGFTALLVFHEFVTYNINFILLKKVIFIISLTFFAFSSIHKAGSLFGIIGMGALVLSTSFTTSVKVKDPRVKRSRDVYIVIAVLVALWEMLSFILETRSEWSNKFPTISSLTDPALHHIAGKLLFIAIFGAVGWALFFHKVVNDASEY